MDYRAAAIEAANRYGIPPDLFLRQVGAESSWTPGAVSPVGAQGLAQLMPGTAAELGVDPTDPLQNLDGGARYLRQQYDTFGDWTLALAAYNAGPGNVRKYGGVPPFRETQDYVAKLTGGPAQGDNALSGMSGYGNPMLPPEAQQVAAMNALAPPERPQMPQINMLDPAAFMSKRRFG